MAILKWLLIVALCVVGTILLFGGFGVGIDAIQIKGIKANGVPAGAVVYMLAVGLAHFWKVTRQETIKTRTDGSEYERVITHAASVVDLDESGD